MPNVSFAELVSSLVAVAVLAASIGSLIAWGIRARRRSQQDRLRREIARVVQGVRRVRAERDPGKRKALESVLQERFRVLAEGRGRERPQPELARLYRALADAFVRSPEVDLEYGRRRVDGRLGPLTSTIQKYGKTHALLSEAEASFESPLVASLPESGRRALLLVYFYALEEYTSHRLRRLVPRGATLLVGDRGHINLRRRGWEAKWAELSLGNLVYIADWNRHFFIADDVRWNREVQPRLQLAVEARNRTAHPGWPTPSLDEVRRIVYDSLTSMEVVLKAPLSPDRLAPPLPGVTAGGPARREGSSGAR